MCELPGVQRSQKRDNRAGGRSGVGREWGGGGVSSRPAACEKGESMGGGERVEERRRRGGSDGARGQGEERKGEAVAAPARVGAAGGDGARL